MGNVVVVSFLETANINDHVYFRCAGLNCLRSFENLGGCGAGTEREANNCAGFYNRA